MYRQEKVADESVQATRASLKVKRRWLPARILDKAGKLMPFPCEVKAGETYIIEADDCEHWKRSPDTCPRRESCMYHYYIACPLLEADKAGLKAYALEGAKKPKEAKRE